MAAALPRAIRIPAAVVPRTQERAAEEASSFGFMVCDLYFPGYRLRVDATSFRAFSLSPTLFFPHPPTPLPVYLSISLSRSLALPLSLALSLSHSPAWRLHSPVPSGSRQQSFPAHKSAPQSRHKVGSVGSVLHRSHFLSVAACTHACVLLRNRFRPFKRLVSSF